MRAAWFLLACQGPLSRLCVRRCVVPGHAPADTEPRWVNRGGGNDGSVSEPDTGTLQVILTTVCFCPLKLVIRGRTLPRTPRGAEQGGAPPPHLHLHLHWFHLNTRYIPRISPLGTFCFWHRHAARGVTQEKSSTLPGRCSPRFPEPIGLCAISGIRLSVPRSGGR